MGLNNMVLVISLLIFLKLIYDANSQGNVECTSTGRFADMNDPTCRNYTLCVFNNNLNRFFAYNYVCPFVSLFDSELGVCSTNYTCPYHRSARTNTPLCVEDSFVADPESRDCTSYIQCINVNGIFDEIELPCPSGFFFNPATTHCEQNYTCPWTSQFSCSQAGRFPDPRDPSCTNYFLCVLANNGTYLQFTYACPSTSLFNPTSRTCTTSYSCPGKY